MEKRGLDKPRLIDPVGRVAIPTEIRNIFNISAGDALEIFVDDKTIVFQIYRPGCVFCDTIDDIHLFKGKKICGDCIVEMNKIPRVTVGSIYTKSIVD